MSDKSELKFKISSFPRASSCFDWHCSSLFVFESSILRPQLIQNNWIERFQAKEIRSEQLQNETTSTDSFMRYAKLNNIISSDSFQSFDAKIRSRSEEDRQSSSISSWSTQISSIHYLFYLMLCCDSLFTGLLFCWFVWLIYSWALFHWCVWCIGWCISIYLGILLICWQWFWFSLLSLAALLCSTVTALFSF